MKSFLVFLSTTGVQLAIFAFAAFLFIFWLLRGSPIGQDAELEDDEDAPLRSYRDRVIGAVSLGIVLILVGGWIALAEGVGWSLIAFLPGFGIVLALVAKNQGYRHGSPALRRTFTLSSTILNASLLLGILVVLNVIAFRYGGEPIDMTTEAAFSLSSLSINQVRALDQPVAFTAFFGKGPQSSQQSERVRQLLDLYKAANPGRVRVDAVDPYRDITRFDAVLKRVPELAVTQGQGGGVVVEYGEEPRVGRVILRNVDLFDQPKVSPFDPNVNRYESVFKGEDAITSAILRLREGDKPKIAFTKNHGELPLQGNDPKQPGLGLLRTRLVSTGAEVLELDLLKDKIPDDVALIVIAGPTSKFQAEEIQKLQTYAMGRQPILMFVSDVDATGLAPLLASFRVQLQNGVIFDSSQNFRGYPAMVSIGIAAQSSPIFAAMENRRLLFPSGAPLKPFSKGPEGAQPFDVVTQPILKTGDKSWLVTDPTRSTREPGPDSIKGPFVVAMASTGRPDESPDPNSQRPRFVVFSSRDFADNRLIQIESTNLDVVMNSIGWLRNREELLGITPKTHVSPTLTADPLLRARLVLVPTVMSFLLILSAGVSTYLSRRS